MIDPEEFIEFANSFPSGFLKTWKAHSIVNTIQDLRDSFINDDERFLKYLRNCLEMEGFSKASIVTIKDFLKERM